MVRVKAVVGREDYGGLLTSKPQKRSEHHVVVTVSAFQAVVEDAEVPVVDVILSGRVIPRESVAEVVDGVVVNSHEIPWLAFDKGGSSRVNGGAIGNDP